MELDTVVEVDVLKVEPVEELKLLEEEELDDELEELDEELEALEELDEELEELPTVSVAALDVAVPQPLVNTARYWKPLCPLWAVKDSVGDVAPVTLVKLAPPLLLTCHCTDADPVAAAVNVAVAPAFAVWLAGLVVITGAALTVSVAAVEVAVPATLVNTARY